MDYGYSTTSYGAQGGNEDGGFMAGSQDSPSAKRSYGKETLRPVTIKQLLEAEQPDSENFAIDGSELTTISFVGQIRNISKQTTNITYKLDDGTGTIEVKVWIDMETAQNEDENGSKGGLVENSYARVWGKLKTFGKRHVVAQQIRPLTDLNEVNYHMLEATYVHLFFTRGPLGAQQQGQQGQGAANGGHASGGGGTLPAGVSSHARKVFQCMQNTPQINEGLHMQDIASRTGMDVADVLKGADELQAMGKIYPTVDDQTWCLLEM
ncbi:replication protein A, subunit RPA32 [Aureobasidium pullulans]|uniref:Replication protein A, subunit RPA32 n=1 Tax=Aureobasidium pullulans TaxID=5580 RepID=A0A4S8XVS2_AURPU|nr:replication protein A, subunit RPA32 [Aureobasidium pullulans]THW44959.1 replication protein A, subunit RPA32 [Aureobasidium pullulans]THX12375.1 replication protein A, subunit RPA32 [Aureobasidium pullulans]